MDYDRIDSGLMTREDLLERLKHETGVLKTPELIRAFEKIDRADFVDTDYKVEAYEDYALPIGEGQTISQPTTIAFMLELLGAQEGDTVLDIGVGSGWATALLGEVVGETGRVYGIERESILVQKSKANLLRYRLPVEISQSEKGQKGLDEYAPYNRILVSAAFDKDAGVPQELFDQLEVGGVLVAPWGEALYRFEKISESEIEEQHYPGFDFVPYVE